MGQSSNSCSADVYGGSRASSFDLDTDTEPTRGSFCSRSLWFGDPRVNSRRWGSHILLQPTSRRAFQAFQQHNRGTSRRTSYKMKLTCQTILLALAMGWSSCPVEVLAIKCGNKLTEDCLGDKDPRYDPDASNDLEDQAAIWKKSSGFYRYQWLIYNESGLPERMVNGLPFRYVCRMIRCFFLVKEKPVPITSHLI